jgi:hypothetical protein
MTVRVIQPNPIELFRPIERERVEPVRNPETGRLTYPWMTEDGRAVDSNGYVVDEAEERRKHDEQIWLEGHAQR